MKYAVSIEVDVSRERFVELFDNPENLYHWQKGLKSFEHLSGDPGQPGAKSRLVFQMGKREMVLIETITKQDLPREFNGTYETEGVFNIVQNRFESVGPNRTRWTSENEFQFSSWFMKVVGFLMKGAFPKQTLKYLTDFKAFAESGKDVRNGV
jgi:hypothetical protein